MSKSSSAKQLRNHFQIVWLNAALLTVVTEQVADTSLSRIDSIIRAAGGCEEDLEELIGGAESRNENK